MQTQTLITLITLMLALLLTFVGCSPTQPLTSQEKNKLVGVWRSDGYGYLAEVTPQRIRLYSENANGSILEDDSPLESLKGEFPSLRFPSPNIVELGRSPDGKHIRYRRIDSLPASVSQPPANTPTATFEVFASTLEQHYAFFDLHGVNWQERVNRTRPRIHNDLTEEELFDLLLGMLDGIQDGHLGIKAHHRKQSKYHLRDTFPLLKSSYAQQSKFPTIRDYTNDWKKKVASRIEPQILAGSQHTTARGHLRWGVVDEVAYLNIAQFGMYALIPTSKNDLAATEKALDQILVDISSAKALVIDCSLSRGGRDEVALAIANRFLMANSPPRLAATKYPADAADPNLTPLYLQPQQKLTFQGPIILVTSDHTVSAAEIFTLAMRAIPRVTHVGRPTNGSLSDMLEKPLPNDWTLALSNEIYLDPTGKNYERIGITPDQMRPIFHSDALIESHSHSIQTIMAELRVRAR
ncbi:MAG: S41 family peptidase [Roseibacillus sp.]